MRWLKTRHALCRAGLRVLEALHFSDFLARVKVAQVSPPNFPQFLGCYRVDFALS